jgi:class 3 adenylate cyclase
LSKIWVPRRSVGEPVQVRGDDLGGLAVHFAARIAALATSQEIFVSSTLKDPVIGSGVEFAERGDYNLKGRAGTWKLFAVMGRQTGDYW